MNPSLTMISAGPSPQHLCHCLEWRRRMVDNTGAEWTSRSHQQDSGKWTSLSSVSSLKSSFWYSKVQRKNSSSEIFLMWTCGGRIDLSSGNIRKNDWSYCQLIFCNFSTLTWEIKSKLVSPRILIKSSRFSREFQTHELFYKTNKCHFIFSRQKA